jgi:16S rRNA (cytidine1402-2'-O)-methyltransferase
MGTLYLVSTPIGNLEDITQRALRILREVALIAAEDTRHTRRLLARYDIATHCIAYHEHNKLTRLDDILAALTGSDVALVSDAGTPAVSDPGFELVRACIDAGFDVSPIPGASAPIAALVASGLPTDSFFYVGFLPRRSSERRTFLARLTEIPATLVCFEAPHRLVAALRDIEATLGDRPMVVAREVTKMHEEFVRLPVSAARAHFEAHPPRGECTLVIAGAAEAPPPTEGEEEARIIERLQTLRAAGQSSSAAARQVARELGVSRRVVYQLGLSLPAPDASQEAESPDES